MKPRQEYAHRYPGKNPNEDPPGKDLPDIPRVGEENPEKPGFGFIKPSSPRNLEIEETETNPQPIINWGRKG